MSFRSLRLAARAVDHGDGGDHRAGQRPAAGLVDAGHSSLAEQFEPEARHIPRRLF